MAMTYINVVNLERKESRHPERCDTLFASKRGAVWRRVPHTLLKAIEMIAFDILYVAMPSEYLM